MAVMPQRWRLPFALEKEGEEEAAAPPPLLPPLCSLGHFRPSSLNCRGPILFDFCVCSHCRRQGKKHHSRTT